MCIRDRGHRWRGHRALVVLRRAHLLYRRLGFLLGRAPLGWLGGFLLGRAPLGWLGGFLLGRAPLGWLGGFLLGRAPLGWLGGFLLGRAPLGWRGGLSGFDLVPGLLNGEGHSLGVRTLLGLVPCRLAVARGGLVGLTCVGRCGGCAGHKASTGKQCRNPCRCECLSSHYLVLPCYCPVLGALGAVARYGFSRRLRPSPRNMGGIHTSWRTPST